MGPSASNTAERRAVGIVMCDVEFVVKLDNSNSIHVPYDWFPRLLHSTPEEREDWRLIDDGRGINWEKIDEDICLAGLLEGRRSGESESSLARWHATRALGKA